MHTLDEVVVEHHYPAAFALLREQGPLAVAVLHVLVSRAAEERDGSFVTRASVREIAEELESVSKDSVHRALRGLMRAGVIEPTGTAPSTYVVRLRGWGIAVRTPDLPF
jgi:DNA-binding IclR family transcriptional regulator